MFFCFTLPFLYDLILLHFKHKEGFITIYQRILTEQHRLEEQLNSLKSQLLNFPTGKLICTRNGNRYKWYQSDGHTQTYIPKKDRTLAEQLAAKKYLSLLYDDLLHEKRALDFYLRHHKPCPWQAERMITDMPEYQKLLSSFFKPISEELLSWMNSPFEQNTKYPEQRIHKTSSGNLVRSKSEVLIDMALYTNKLPFRYECALHLGESTIYPDFTIRHPYTGATYYWEHFGLMDDSAYSKNACSKLQLYISHGIIPSINLITTYETKSHPLSSEMVENLVREYFC